MFYCGDKNNGLAGSKTFRQKFGDGFIDECTAVVVEVNMVVGMRLLRINSCVAQAVLLLDVYSLRELDRDCHKCHFSRLPVCCPIFRIHHIDRYKLWTKRRSGLPYTDGP